MTPNHRDAVMRLWAENMTALQQSEVLIQRFQWFYEQNSSGSADTVLAVSDHAGEVVGCASAFPRRMRIAGTDLTAGVPVDFAVSRAHRSAAAALKLQRALLAGACPEFSFFLGFPNKAALPVLQRVGYTPFALAHAWIKPLTANYRIARYLKSRALTSAVAAPVNVFLASADTWLARGEPIGTRHEFVTHADERFDTLWTRAGPNYVAAGHRTAEYLNWRYAAFPTIDYRFFCLTAASSMELLGYVAFTLKGNKAYVGDLFALDMQQTAEHVLLAFARALRKEGLDSIFIGYAGNPAFERRLQRLGFIERAGPQRSMVALTTNTSAQQAQVIQDPASWYFFEGEMDI